MAVGDIDGKPFSVAKIGAYMRVPRSAVIRRAKPAKLGLVDRFGHIAVLTASLEWKNRSDETSKKTLPRQ